jgi:hypothetical protein
VKELELHEPRAAGNDRGEEDAKISSAPFSSR